MTFKSEPNLLDRDRRMAEIPDVTNKLCDLLWKFVEVKDGLGISIITYALGKRSDLTNSQLKAIMDRIQLLSVGSLDGYSLDDMFFVGGGVYLFRDHPSQEIEDLANLLLKKKSKYIKICAAQTLAKIGTRKSVEPMRQYVEDSSLSLDPAWRTASSEKMSKAAPEVAQQELLQRLRALEQEV